MKRIWKYEIPLADRVGVSMAVGARLLHFDDQDGICNLWVLIDDDEQALEQRMFRVFGTGREIEDAELLKYVGTVVQFNGLVWHLFEVLS